MLLLTAGLVEGLARLRDVHAGFAVGYEQEIIVDRHRVGHDDRRIEAECGGIGQRYGSHHGSGVHAQDLDPTGARRDKGLSSDHFHRGLRFWDIRAGERVLTQQQKGLLVIDGDLTGRPLQHNHLAAGHIHPACVVQIDGAGECQRALVERGQRPGVPGGGVDGACGNHHACSGKARERRALVAFQHELPGAQLDHLQHRWVRIRGITGCRGYVDVPPVDRHRVDVRIVE